MIKGIFVDGYKTIEKSSNFRTSSSKCFQQISKVVGCKKEDIEEHSMLFRLQFGDSVWEYHEIFWRSLIKKYCCSYDENLIDSVYEIVLDYYEKEVVLYDDVIDTLIELSKKVKLILIANGNSKRLKRLINKFNLDAIFTDFVISSETPYKKPDKFMFQYPLNIYGLNPNEVLMVGDRYDTDIVGAKKCGLLTAMLTTETKSPKSYTATPDFTIDSFSELKNIVSFFEQREIAIMDSIISFTNNEENDISAFIVAGGKGSRLGKLGEHTQKCMLELWNRPLLYYTVLSLKNCGCSKIVIAVNHLKEQVKEYFGNGADIGVKIEYVEGNFISTYDALIHSLDHLTNKIIYVHANILFQNRLLENIITIGEQENRSVISVINNATNSVRHAQVLVDSTNKVIAIDLKERGGIYPYTFLGVAYYKKDDIVRLYNQNNNGMVEKIIQQLINENNEKGVLAYKYTGGWRHIETESDYLRIKNENRWEIYGEN